MPSFGLQRGTAREAYTALARGHGVFGAAVFCKFFGQHRRITGVFRLNRSASCAAKNCANNAQLALVGSA